MAGAPSGEDGAGVSSLAASCASEMTTAPTSAIPSPITATTTCHVGLLEPLVEEEDADENADDGFATDTVATDGARRPVPSDTCWSTKPRTPVSASA